MGVGNGSVWTDTPAPLAERSSEEKPRSGARIKPTPLKEVIADVLKVKPPMKGPKQKQEHRFGYDKPRRPQPPKGGPKHSGGARGHVVPPRGFVKPPSRSR